MLSKEEFEKRKAEAIARGDEVKKRLGITVERYITDYEELLKGNYVTYPMEDVPPKELKRRLFEREKEVIENYAASQGIIVEVKLLGDVDSLA